MRALIMAAVVVVSTAAPSFAQSERAYIAVGGGVASAPDATSGDVAGQFGVRVARNLFVFADVGQFHNLQPSIVQPAVDAADASLASSGATVTGTGRVPAWHTIGGVRYSIPTHRGISPYVLGGAGFARLSPTAQFIYQDGTLPDTTITPTTGDDVTAQVVASGAFVQPVATNAFMFTAGGGVEVPVAPHMSVDVGYRVSRISTDTPVNAQSVVAGVSYRF
jgi:opacity protein-like surface antigen